MQSTYPRTMRFFGWRAALAAILQARGLIRDSNRLPDDWVGSTLYAITLLAFIAPSIGAFFQARKIAP